MYSSQGNILSDARLSTIQSNRNVATNTVANAVKALNMTANTVTADTLNVTSLTVNEIIATNITSTDVVTDNIDLTDINGSLYVPFLGLRGIPFIHISFDTDTSLFVIQSYEGETLATESTINAAINTAAASYLTTGRTHNETIKVEYGQYDVSGPLILQDYMTLDLSECTFDYVDNASDYMVLMDGLTEAHIFGGQFSESNASIANSVDIIQMLNCTKSSVSGVVIEDGDTGILIQGGSYNNVSNSRIVDTNQGISLTSDAQFINLTNNTILTAYVYGIVINPGTSKFVLIRDCEITGQPATLSIGVAVLNGIDSVQIAACSIHDMLAEGIYLSTTTNTNVCGCDLFNNASVDANTYPCVRVVNSSHVTVSACNIGKTAASTNAGILETGTSNYNCYTSNVFTNFTVSITMTGANNVPSNANKNTYNSLS